MIEFYKLKPGDNKIRILPLAGYKWDYPNFRLSSDAKFTLHAYRNPSRQWLECKGDSCPVCAPVEYERQLVVWEGEGGAINVT